MTSFITNETKSNQRSVHFGEKQTVHWIDAEELGEENWLDAREMKQAFREDVIAFLTACNNNKQESHESQDPVGKAQEPVCSRGLEMYFPGELQQRRKHKNLVVSSILRRANDLKRYFDEPSEAAEHLQAFASSLNKIPHKRANAIALQDAVEARIIYAEGLEAGNSKNPTALYVKMLKHETTTDPSTDKARAA